MNQTVVQRDTTIKSQKKQQEELNVKIKNLEGQILQKNEIIVSHERKIADLKKQSVDLEKLRYVLSFKFNKLRNEVAPKDELIQEMRSKLKYMDDELQKVSREKGDLSNEVKNREDRNSIMKNELNAQKEQLNEKTRALTSLIRTLSEVVSRGEPKLTNHELKKM